MHRQHQLASTLSVIVLVTGCPPKEEPETSDRTCVPYDQRVCACANGIDGYQACKPDGTGFGACEGCDNASSSSGQVTSSGGTGTSGSGSTTSSSGGVSSSSGGTVGVDPMRSTITVVPEHALVANGLEQFTFVVEVRNSANDPLAQKTVQFISDGTGNTLSDTTTTDSNGRAVGTLSSTKAETKTIIVLADGVALDTVPQVTFVSGPPAVIALLGGDQQTGTAGTPLGTPLSVLVTDANQNPSPGVTVAFHVTGGGGALAPSRPVTNPEGVAASTFTMGVTVGLNTATAAVDGVSGSPVGFTATATAGPAFKISKVSGDAQVGTVGAAVSNALVVLVADAHDNVKAGATVTFAVASGGGSITPSGDVIADQSGQAQVVLSLGTTAGENTATASLSDVPGSAVTFSATGTPGPATKIEKHSGDTQTGVVGTAVSSPLAVVVKDAFDNAKPGETVVFLVVNGGGAVEPSGDVTTDAQGRAQTVLTLGTVVGTNTVSAVSAGLAGSPVSFTATATTGPATQIAKVRGDGQTGNVGTALADPFVVIVRDAYGNPRPGATVQFTVTSGGGATLPSGNATTDAQGVAQTYLTLGAHGGTNQVTATGAGLTGSPITFTAMAIAPPAVIEPVGGDGQTATVQTVVPRPLVVLVKDSDGNAKSGVAVTFTVTGGGGTISPAGEVTTDPQGRAETFLTLGPTAGLNTVTATVTGLTGSPVTFTAAGTAGPAAKLEKVNGDAQTGTVGTTLANPMVVVVKDPNDNVKSGVAVVFQVASGAGSIAPNGTVTTDALGRAQTVLTLGTTAGANSVSATCAGLTGSPLTFTATGTAGAAAIIEKVSGDGQGGSAGAALANPFVAVVRDANNNPKQGFTVAFSVASGGGSIQPSGSVVTDAQGQVQTVLTLGPSSGLNSVTAVATGLVGSPLTFTATAAGPAAAIELVSGAGQTGTVQTTLPQPLVVVVKDAAGSPKPGYAITFSLISGGGSIAPNGVVSTDQTGQAQTSLTLGSLVGTNTVTATAGALAGSPVTFTATGAAGPPTQIAKAGGDSQSGTPGTTLSSPLVVMVTDAHGNPTSGVAVTFAVASGGGSIVPSGLVSTDASGRAETLLTLGPVSGSNAVTASSAGLVGSPLTFTATAAGSAWVAIPAGSFQMGSPVGETGRNVDEVQHGVTLSHSFEMWTSEVSQSDFLALMGWNPSFNTVCGGDCPVEHVTWHEAAAYTNALSQAAGLAECYVCTGTGTTQTCAPNQDYPSPYLCPGYRLPTAAEWEYAARAGTTGGTYAGTSDAAHQDCEVSNPALVSISWYCGNSGSTTHAVRGKTPNPWGLYDMIGNVWEWCHDGYGGFAAEAVTDPWIAGGPYRAQRGCSRASGGRNCRSAQRGYNYPTVREEAGFRPVRTLGAMPSAWVNVEPGTFNMGSPVTEPGRGADETLHQVALTHMFQIQASEVTQGQFEQLMARNPANFTGCGSGCPVDKVSWHEAAAYTNALSNLAGLPSCYTCTGTGAAVTCSASASYLSPYDCSGYRLPTEAEWEYAVRAGTSAATYNGTPDSAHLACEQPNAVLDSIAWYCGNALATTHVGGQKSANAYGMYDMLGSLWEWVHDYYAAYPTTPVSDPWGPSSGGERVCRGGGWNYHGFYERAAQRGKNLPTYNQFDIGFRPARTL